MMRSVYMCVCVYACVRSVCVCVYACVCTHGRAGKYHLASGPYEAVCSGAESDLQSRFKLKNDNYCCYGLNLSNPYVEVLTPSILESDRIWR